MTDIDKTINKLRTDIYTTTTDKSTQLAIFELLATMLTTQAETNELLKKQYDRQYNILVKLRDIRNAQ